MIPFPFEQLPTARQSTNCVVAQKKTPLNDCSILYWMRISLQKQITAKNDLDKNIVHWARNDESDWHRARRSHIRRSWRSTSSPDLPRDAIANEHTFHTALTAVAAHAKILCHLDERWLRVLNEIVGEGELLAVTTQCRLDVFALVQRTSNPCRVIFVTVLFQQCRDSIKLRIDLS